MKLFKTVMAGILCMMVSQAMAYMEFMEHIDECHWLTNDQKEIFKQLPPLNKYADDVIEDEKKKIQDEYDINLEKAKANAISFYSKYLEHLPKEFLEIATSIIQQGEYTYSEECLAGFKASAMKVIPYNIEIPDKIEEQDDIQDYLAHKIEVILSAVSFGEIMDKMLEPFRKQYLNKDKITENFGIKVVYNNRTDLLMQIIHETAHILDYAYRIKNNIYTENVKGENHESVSVFFELLAKKEYGQSLFDKIRLAELYREMLHHDYLRRVFKDLKKTEVVQREEDNTEKAEKPEVAQPGYKKTEEIVVDQKKLDKIKKDIDKDWSSKLDWIIKYIDFDDERGDETKKALKIIAKGAQGIYVSCEYIHNIGRAFDIISANNITAKDIPDIFEKLVTETTKPISAETFQKWLNN